MKISPLTGAEPLSRFVCLYEVLRETNSIREGEEECRYQGEICSIYQSIKDY